MSLQNNVQLGATGIVLSFAFETNRRAPARLDGTIAATGQTGARRSKVFVCPKPDLTAQIFYRMISATDKISFASGRSLFLKS
jgi:hypothetical protein